MRSKSVFRRLLFLFCLVTLLPLSSTWVATADPPSPLKQQLASPQPATGDQDMTAEGDIGALSTGVLYPSHDAPVREGAPDATAPDALLLGAGYDDGSLYGSTGLIQSYLRFDLSSLPSVVNIASATLRLYHFGGSDFPGVSRDVTFYRVTEDWNETTIIWNNRPGYAEAVGSVSTTYNYVGWLSLDVTDQVRAWVDGGHDNCGLVAIGPESIEGIYRVFASGEEVHRPELHIHFSTVPPPVLDVSPGTLSVKASDSKQLSVQISNVTINTLDWTATKLGGAPWLTLDSSSGSVTPTTPDNLDLTVDPTGLTAGNVYTEQIRISSNTAGVAGSPLTVTVTLEAFDSLSQAYLPVILKNSTGTGDNAPRVVALLIGIGDYLNLEPPPQSSDLPDYYEYDLSAPPKDESDWAILLQSKFGVPTDNIIRCGECLVGSSNAQFSSGRLNQEISEACISPATKANVIAAFTQLDHMEDENTIVIFYFSGHGGQVPDEPDGDESDELDEFIAMYDTDKVGNTFINVLTDDELEGLLANLESRHIVVILDSCYSGGMMSLAAQSSGGGLLKRGLTNPLGADVNTQEDLAAMAELVQVGRLIITAGTGDQSTWESSELENGIFTYFFLQALEDSLHDANQNGIVSFEEAYWFSRDVVDVWVFARESEHQNPDISDKYFGQIELP